MITDRDIAQAWEGIDGITGGIEKNEWINMITKEENSWTNHRKNSKMTDERDWITGKNLKNQ